MTTVTRPATHSSTRRAGMPVGLSRAETQILVSNSATGGTTLRSDFSSRGGDVGLDRSRPVSACSFPNTGQQGVELSLPLRFGVDGNQTDFSPLQAKTLKRFQHSLFKTCADELCHSIRPSSWLDPMWHYTGSRLDEMQGAVIGVEGRESFPHHRINWIGPGLDFDNWEENKKVGSCFLS